LRHPQGNQDRGTVVIVIVW